jgi:hypothetical protein
VSRLLRSPSQPFICEGWVSGLFLKSSTDRIGPQPNGDYPNLNSSGPCLHTKFYSWAMLNRCLDGSQEPFERDPSWTENQVGEYRGPVCHSFVNDRGCKKMLDNTIDGEVGK